jgi:2'-hydroxyisoflavone reductase
VKLLLLGGPRFLGRAVADEALECGHELAFFNHGRNDPAALLAEWHGRG